MIFDPTTFQARCRRWIEEVFGLGPADDRQERNHRFLEEALELVQSLGCTKDDALKLVDYVFDRPAGEPHQEVGGVMTTLASLCAANRMDMILAGETELERCWVIKDKIRAKWLTKPRFSPLPGSLPS